MNNALITYKCNNSAGTPKLASKICLDLIQQQYSTDKQTFLNQLRAQNNMCHCRTWPESFKKKAYEGRDELAN